MMNAFNKIKPLFHELNIWLEELNNNFDDIKANAVKTISLNIKHYIYLIKLYLRKIIIKF